MATLAEGFQIGPYRVVAELGRGGMASVYRAYQPSLDRFVAVKVLHQSGEPTFRERFRREARTVAHLRHPNIVQVYDFGEQDDLVYLVMELVEGTTLRERMAGPMPPEQALGIISQLGAALDYAHANSVIHRDVKPGNVLIDSDGRVLLGDFGIARLQADSGLTREQSSLGTPEYMSPEQASAMEVGPASDIYSLGIVTFQLLTGQVPFKADTPLAVLHAHVHTPLPPASATNPALPPALDAALERALAKRPEDRTSSGADLVRELRGALEPDDEGATRLTAMYLPPVSAQAGRLQLRSWMALGLAVLVALLAAWFVVRPLANLAARTSPLGLAAGRQASPPPSSGGATAPASAPATSPIATSVPVAGAADATAASAISAAATFGANASAAAAATATAATAAGAGTEPSPPRSATPFPAIAPTPVSVGANPPIHMMTSSDGTHFSNEVILGDAKGHVMSAVAVGPGTTRVYATDSEFLRLRSWKSAGTTWLSEPTEVQGAPSGLLYGSVVALPDGGFRLYYLPQNGPTSTLPGPRDILSARSADGVRFVQEPGARFTHEGLTTVTVAKTDASWMMLFRLENQTSAGGARSSDGMSFTFDPSIAFEAPNTFRVTSFDGAHHFLQYRFETAKVERLTSNDAATWRLDKELDARFRDGTGPSPELMIKDAGGQYRLIYSWVLLPSSAAKPSGTP